MAKRTSKGGSFYNIIVRLSFTVMLGVGGPTLLSLGNTSFQVCAAGPPGAIRMLPHAHCIMMPVLVLVIGVTLATGLAVGMGYAVRAIVRSYKD